MFRVPSPLDSSLREPRWQTARSVAWWLVGLAFALIVVMSLLSALSEGRSVRFRNEHYLRSAAMQAAGMFDREEFNAGGDAYLRQILKRLHKTGADVDVNGIEMRLAVEGDRLLVWSVGEDKRDDHGKGDDVLVSDQLYQ